MKYQEYLFKPPKKNLIENVGRALKNIEHWYGDIIMVTIISSEGSDDKTKMFTYITTGQCEDDKK